MKSICGNIYKIARTNAGLTQDKAAELLYTSSRSITDYETSRTIPPDDIVCRMVELYEAPWLAYEFLRGSTEVGKRYLPEVEHVDLAKSVLRLQKEVSDLKNINEDMIEIACDGFIEEHEKCKWQLISKEVRDIIGAAFSLVFAK